MPKDGLPKDGMTQTDRRFRHARLISHGGADLGIAVTACIAAFDTLSSTERRALWALLRERYFSTL